MRRGAIAVSFRAKTIVGLRRSVGSSAKGLTVLRIVHMSDLHLEFEAPKYAASDWPRSAATPATAPLHPSVGPRLQGLRGADLAILAGDVAPGIACIDYADAVASFANCPVVVVPGNHEYYGQDFPSMRRQLRDAAWATDGRVIFLDRDWVRLWFGDEELLVFGCTLWTDYAVNGDAERGRAYAAAHLNDHRRISFGDQWFMPEQAAAEHRQSLAWLDEVMAPAKLAESPARRLVVTHHAPCRQALGNLDADLAPAYASDLQDQICRWAPDAWLHGHTHHRHATKIGPTLVASAPRGYASDREAVERFRHDELQL